MTEETLFLAVIAVGTIVLLFVVALPNPRRAAIAGETESLLRFAATAAIAVLSTALLYLADEATGSRIALALGDGMMVLAPWMTWSALRAVNGRTRLAPFLSLGAAATSTAVSLVIPETPATTVKLVIVALGCLLFGATSLRGRLRTTTASGIFTGVGFGFGCYILARVAVIAFLGTESTVYDRAFTTVVSTLVSGLAVVAMTVGTALLFREIVTRPSRSTTPAVALSVAEQVLAQGRALVVYRMRVDEIELVRRAHGAAAAEVVRDALVESAASRLPTGVLALSPHGGHLTIVEAERRGAPSIAGELARAFDAELTRVGLADLVQVDVERFVVRTSPEMAAALAHLPVSDGRPMSSVGRRAPGAVASLA